MIILIPFLILITSLAIAVYFFIKHSYSSAGMLFVALSAFPGVFLVFVLIGFIFTYNSYTTNLATLAYCTESVNEGTIELKETIAINENDKIYNNKFSKTTTFASNNDTAITSTQEYLHDIQKDRSIERKKCIQAMRDVMGFKLGFYGFAVK